MKRLLIFTFSLFVLLLSSCGYYGHGLGLMIRFSVIDLKNNEIIWLRMCDKNDLI